MQEYKIIKEKTCIPSSPSIKEHSPGALRERLKSHHLMLFWIFTLCRGKDYLENRVKEKRKQITHILICFAGRTVCLKLLLNFINIEDVQNSASI